MLPTAGCQLGAETARVGREVVPRCPGAPGELLGVYDAPGAADDAPLSQAPAGRPLRAPPRPGVYELRRLRRAGAALQVLQRAPLQVLP